MKYNETLVVGLLMMATAVMVSTVYPVKNMLAAFVGAIAGAGLACLLIGIDKEDFK